MTIQKVSYQPAFGHRLPIAGKPQEIEEVIGAIAKEGVRVANITKNKGKVAYVVTNDDLPRLNGKSGEVAEDVFTSIAGRQDPVKAKDIIAAIKAHRFDFDTLSMPR